MKKFFFRLETLLKVRKAHEGKIKRELARANQKWSELKEKERTLEGQIASLMEEIRKKREEGNIALHETYTQILDHLNASLSQVLQGAAGHQKQIVELQERLKQAVQERKVIEKIREKHYAGWRIQGEQIEGALLDEINLKKSSSPK